MFHILDVSHIIHPMFHGLPPMARPSDNHPVGVVHGCCSTFWRVAKEDPSHIAAVYDGRNSSATRREIAPDYKSNRPPLHPDLVCQIPLARRAAEAFGIMGVDKDRAEADDVIASLVRQALASGHEEIVILSSDKDLMQLLVHPEVTMFDPVRRRRIDPSYLMTKWGIQPDHVADFLAMVGDVSDNVPGVPKIGEKTAAKLINEFGDIEQILANLDNISAPAVQKSLAENGWRARLSKKLVSLDHDIEIPDISEFAYTGIPSQQIVEFMDEMELVTLRQEIAEGMMEAA